MIRSARKFKFNVFDTIAQAPHDAYFEIVGVVSDVKNQGLEEAPMPQADIPYTTTAYANRAILVKTPVAPLSLLKNARNEIWAVDRNFAIGNAEHLTATSISFRMLNRDSVLSRLVHLPESVFCSQPSDCSA